MGNKVWAKAESKNGAHAGTIRPDGGSDRITCTQVIGHEIGGRSRIRGHFEKMRLVTADSQTCGGSGDVSRVWVGGGAAGTPHNPQVLGRGAKLKVTF